MQEYPVAQLLGQGGIAAHLAFHFQIRGALADQFQGLGHLARLRRRVRAETGMRQQRYLRWHEAGDFLGGEQGDFGDLLGAGIGVEVGIAEEQRSVGSDQHVHRRRGFHARAQADDVEYILDVVGVAADQAAEQGISVTEAQQQRADHRGAGIDADARLAWINALAAAQPVIFLPAVFVVGVVLRIDQLKITVGANAQAQFSDALFHPPAPANQDRRSQAVIEYRLRCPQDPLFLALGIQHPLAVGLGAIEQWPHHQAGAIDPLAELGVIGAEVADRPGSDAAVHGSPRDRQRQGQQQARFEGLGNQILRAEVERLVAISGGFLLGMRLARQVGQGAHAGQLHRFIDRGRADVQRAAEDIWEAQDVVDLIGVVGAASGDDRIGPGGLGLFGHDLRHRIGQGQDQGLVGHGLDHITRQHAGLGQTQEHISAHQGLGQGARSGFCSIGGLFRIQCAPSFVDHSAAVADDDVLAAQPQADQQIQAGDARSTGAGSDQPHLTDILADQRQSVKHGGSGDDRGAVLVIVEHRNLHSLAQAALNVEAFRSLDIFQVDAAKAGLQAGNDLYQLVGIVLVDFDIKYIDTGKFLEQHALAFHDRLGRQRADVAEAEHGGAIRDHRHQIAARSDGGHFARILDDDLAGGGNTRRIGQRQIMLVGQRFGRGDFDLAIRGHAVITQGVFAEIVSHGRDGS